MSSWYLNVTDGQTDEQTDRQTDRQTDESNLITALCTSASRGNKKNRSVCSMHLSNYINNNSENTVNGK